MKFVLSLMVVLVVAVNAADPEVQKNFEEKVEPEASQVKPVNLPLPLKPKPVPAYQPKPSPAYQPKPLPAYQPSPKTIRPSIKPLPTALPAYQPTPKTIRPSIKPLPTALPTYKPAPKLIKPISTTTRKSIVNKPVGGGDQSGAYTWKE